MDLRHWLMQGRGLRQLPPLHKTPRASRLRSACLEGVVATREKPVVSEPHHSEREATLWPQSVVVLLGRRF